MIATWKRLTSQCFDDGHGADRLPYMVPDDDFQLLDFGDGRKLERFGDFILDRPAPAAERIDRSQPEIWKTAHAHYQRTDGERGIWESSFPLPKSWTVRLNGIVFEIVPTEFGHLGIFPEQAENWNWISEQIRGANRPLKVLNLFAYTGGSTFAAARNSNFPVEVVHVDAAQSTVAWARSNAALNGLQDANLRWICEDAAKFVRRELKRGNRYDAVILDPPSFGRAPTGAVWKFAEHLPDLLADCVALTAGQPQFMLLSGHTTGVGQQELGQLLSNALTPAQSRLILTDEMHLQIHNLRHLPCGALAKYTRR